MSDDSCLDLKKQGCPGRRYNRNRDPEMGADSAVSTHTGGQQEETESNGDSGTVLHHVKEIPVGHLSGLAFTSSSVGSSWVYTGSRIT